MRVVEHRLGHGLPHGLASREVDHGVEFLGTEGSVDRRGVAEVALDKGHLARLLLPGELLHALETLEEGVVEVVEDGDGVAGVEQGQDGVRACRFFGKEKGKRKGG